jgi:hypothetical protein
MINHAKRFEIIILRPLQIVFLISAVVFLFKGMWWWLVGCAVSVFYLGIVGSKLHPLQSASDLAQGPIEGTAARLESELLPVSVKQMLVGHACTRVGILLGFTAGVVSWAALGWRWYFALLIALLAMLFSGALLKFTFKAIQHNG